MSVELKTVNGITPFLKNIRTGLLQKLMQEIQRQNIYFISDIVRHQMSGRRGSIYANVRTGTLRRSWFADTGIDKSQLTSRVYSTVKYANYLERGTRNMSRRLFVQEAFETNAKERYRKAFVKILGGR